MARSKRDAFLLWSLLLLAAWGGFFPLVWCSGADGHAAIESRDWACCREMGNACAGPGAAASLAFAVPADGSGSTTLLPSRGSCSDSLIHVRPTNVRSTAADSLAAARRLSPALHAGYGPQTRAAASPVSSLRTPLELRTTLLI